MFSWKPIYEEIAAKLLAYRDRQDELISWLHEMKEQGIPVIKLEDENPKNRSIALAEIDPFSFFATFNRPIKDTHRIRCLEVLKNKLELTSALPTDFDGIPVVNLQKAIFFPFAYDRESHMVAALWDLAAEIVTKDSADINAEIFDQCLEIPQVGLAKLTMGMFWMRPDRFMALDSLMASYARDHGAKVGKQGKIKSYADYWDAVQSITSSLGNDYLQISRDAYLYANQLPVSIKELDVGLRELLESEAQRNNMSLQEYAERLSSEPDGGGHENEISNRLRTMPILANILKEDPISMEKLKSACKEVWVLTNGTDSMRRNAFFASGVAEQGIVDLLDEDAGTDVQSRIDTFVALAQENGYSAPNGADGSGAAQFASALLSAAYPDRFVDYRDNRWNKLFKLITQSKKRLCQGSSYGLKLVRAGQFAAALAGTDTFKQYFGTEHSLWKVAGLAWKLKENEIVNNQKKYWAGGFLWGTKDGKGESHLDEFIQGNYWRQGYSPDAKKKQATDTWHLLGQIKPGDEFIIKGYGGRNDLKVHYIGKVVSVDADGVVHLTPLERSLYHGKAPSVGTGGNWFNTLTPVTDTDAIRTVFYADGIRDPKSPSMPDSLNVILYGPPGTGKTYALRNEYVQLFTETQGVKSKGQFAQELVENLSWWEVITLVMYDLGTSKVADVMDHPLMVARIARSENRNPRAAIWAHLQMHTKRDCDTVAYTRRYEPLMFSKSEASVWSIDREIAEAEVPELLEKLNEFKKFDPTSGGVVKRYAFTTFHQSFSYEDFIEGIKPVIGDEVAGDLAYEIRSGVFKQIAQRARIDPAHNYAIFIDEINRGNVASIFGELITLLEDDKRLGAKNELTATLPYSHDLFGVPSNLYVIGTMNTADRSVEALDTALRRRFTFVPCQPNPNLLKDYQPQKLPVDLVKLLTTINARIERLLDDDHCIGHSYFMGLKDAENPFEGLRHVFANKVLPLLQEYFYGDPARIGMVLGKAFVQRRKDACLLAQGDWDPDGIDEREVYTIADPLKLSEEDFVSIYA